MKLTHIFAVMLSLLVVCPARQTGAGASKIVLRLLDGKNGKAIKNEYPNISLGHAGPNWAARTDFKGEIIVDISNVQLFEIRVRPNYYFDCRFKRDQMGSGGLQVSYPLDEIISKGIVGENLCGKTRALPTPGVLVVCVRPRTFMEKWKL
jgi:hypothetical protein